MSARIGGSEKTKAAPPATDSAALKLQQSKCTKTLKWRTTLSQLLLGPRHRFQAELWGDHALHSTVSFLQRNYEIPIDRDWTDVPNRFGSRTRVRRYWIGDEHRIAAMALTAVATPNGEIHGGA